MCHGFCNKKICIANWASNYDKLKTLCDTASGALIRIPPIYKGVVKSLDIDSCEYNGKKVQFIFRIGNTKVTGLRCFGLYREF
jgi:hypothetical protein